MRLRDLCDLWPVWIWTSTVFYFVALGFNNRNPFPFVFLPVVEEPLLSKLTVSNATSDSMSLTWEAQDNAFDHFILEVRNSDFPLDSLVHTVPGASRRYVVTNLKAATNYTAQLHGVIDGQGGQTLTALATTGISLFHRPGLLSSLLSFAVHRTALKHGSNSSSSRWQTRGRSQYREAEMHWAWECLEKERSCTMEKAEKVPPALREPVANRDWFLYIYTYLQVLCIYN